MVALDPVDEGRRVAVDGEPAGDRERLAGGEVGVHLALGRAAVVDDGGGDTAGAPARGGVDRAETGVQGADAPGDRRPPGAAPGRARSACRGSRRRRRAPCRSPSTMAAAPSSRGHRPRLALGQRAGDLVGRAGDVVLGDAAHDDLGREPGLAAARDGAPGRRRRARVVGSPHQRGARRCRVRCQAPRGLRQAATKFGCTTNEVAPAGEGQPTTMRDARAVTMTGAVRPASWSPPSGTAGEPAESTTGSCDEPVTAGAVATAIVGRAGDCAA